MEVGVRRAALTLLVCANAGVAMAQSAGAPGATVDAGFGRGVTITSADETLSLNLRARIQVRGTTIAAEDDGAGMSEILVRRMRLVFKGNALGPSLTYQVELGFASLDQEADLRTPLLDAYVTWIVAPLANLRVGQMKVPFGRQRVVSSSALQLVDRSLAVAELNLDRDVGVTMFSRDLFRSGGKLGYNVGLFGGEGRNRRGRDRGFLYSARLEAAPLGPFDDYVEGVPRRTPGLRLAFGGGVGYNQHTNRSRSTFGDSYTAGDFNYMSAGVDFILEHRGTSVMGEVLYRRADADEKRVAAPEAPATIRSRSGWGAYLQAGHMITDHLEITGRYSRLTPRDGTDPALLRAKEVGGGAGYYVREHNLKVQGDYFAVTTGAARVHQVRVQMQMYF